MCFFGGMFLVLLRWPIFGMILEFSGIIRLFGSYFPMILALLRQVVTEFVYFLSRFLV